MENFYTAKELSELWNISVRRIQILCSNGTIEGAIRFGKVWAIPKTIQKPEDRRIKSGKYIKKIGPLEAYGERL